MRQSADGNTSHQREDKDGDMLLYSREEHGGRTFIRLHEVQVQEGPRWATRCVSGILHTAKTTKQAHKQFHLIYCTSYSLFMEIITLVLSSLLKIFFDCIFSTKYNLPYVCAKCKCTSI